jgi:hypothetical protein
MLLRYNFNHLFKNVFILVNIRVYFYFLIKIDDRGDSSRFNLRKSKSKERDDRSRSPNYNCNDSSAAEEEFPSLEDGGQNQSNSRRSVKVPKNNVVVLIENNADVENTTSGSKTKRPSSVRLIIIFSIMSIFEIFYHYFLLF